jgi:hypothetical protein
VRSIFPNPARGHWFRPAFVARMMLAAGREIGPLDLPIGSTLPDAQANRRQIQATRSEHHSERCLRRHFGLLEPPWASLQAPRWSGIGC